MWRWLFILLLLCNALLFFWYSQQQLEVVASPLPSGPTLELVKPMREE